ncbi:MAG: hypothetical protein IH597_06745 [Bacteroidales bacterium]|nr:hypothetical protein [Bacteroidales bacterium]
MGLQNQTKQFSDKQIGKYPYSIKKFILSHQTLLIYLVVVFNIPGLPGKMVNAQVFKPQWSAGIHSGLLVFYGDIKTNEFAPAIKGFNELRAGFGLQTTYSLNPMLSIRGSLTNGKLAGAKPSTDEYFIANILDYSVQALINLNGLFFYDYDYTPLDVYAIIGYGFVDFRTIKRKLSDDSFVRAFGYNPDGSKSTVITREMSIPVGVIVHSNLEQILNSNNYFLSQTDITLEFVLHNVNTNKLDADLTLREVRDKYSYFAFGLIYYLN